MFLESVYLIHIIYSRLKGLKKSPSFYDIQLGGFFTSRLSCCGNLKLLLTYFDYLFTYFKNIYLIIFLYLEVMSCIIFH